MNVIIQIDVREAMPIRALPFLSDRKTMSPDVVARALAGTEQNGRFVGLRAYRVEHGVVTPIAERWWQTGPCQKLDALSATISAEECPSEHETEDEYKTRHDRELAKWRDKSLGLLPAGAFVFKDEFEQLYRNEFKFGHYHFKGDDGKWLSELDHNKRIALDYSPFVDDPATATLVMAGFESCITPDAVPTNTHKQPSSKANTSQQVALVPPAPAPVGADASNVKPWLLPDPKDPPIVSPKDQPWYTPARYFARQLVLDDTTLLTKKQVLAENVSKSLAGTGIFKRGGKKPHSPETVLKAFANVTLG